MDGRTGLRIFPEFAVTGKSREVDYWNNNEWEEDSTRNNELKSNFVLLVLEIILLFKIDKYIINIIDENINSFLFIIYIGL